MIEFKHIHEDERGSIECFYIDGVEYTILTTKKGFARGGCIHPEHDEYAVILEGIVFYYVMGQPVKQYIKGENLLIKKNTPHYLLATTDAVTLEWGALPKEKDIKDKEFREIVDNINRKRIKDDVQ